MKQDVILNKIQANAEIKGKDFNKHTPHHMYTENWNECCQQVADDLRKEGLEESAKAAEKWRIDR